MSNYLVSIIIVNWNGKDMLRECLESVEHLDYKNYEVFVVDNASTDDSCEMLAQKFPWVKIVKNSCNLGFAGANNIGFKKSQGEFVLLLNNDTKVTPRSLSILVETLLSDSSLAVVQPKLPLMDNLHLLDGTGAFLTDTGFLYHFGLEKNAENPKYNKQAEIFSARGACMLIRRSIIERVGLFDPDFFAYFEETDFCWRVWLAGFKVSYQPKAVVYHAGAKTASKLESAFINFHSFKNRICSLIKNLGTKELIRILPLHVVIVEGFSFFQLIKLKPKMFWALQKALFWNLKNLRKTLEKRAFVQETIRVLPDTKLMPKIKRKVRLSYFYYLITGVAKYKD